MMEEFNCVLEVDVNGEEKFLVDKKILSTFSGRIRKLFGKSTATASKVKVIFHDFPGGAEGFEMMARFCYDNGRIEIAPSKVPLLHSVAHFMEMTEEVSGHLNLVEQTEKSLDEISYWSWSELLIALKQCQDFLPSTSSSVFLKKCLDSLLVKLVSVSDESSAISSPESSAFRFSCDTRSTESSKNYTRPTWWFEDLVIFNMGLIENVIKAMISQKFNHAIVSRFLIYYQKTRSAGAKPEEKCKIIEGVIDLLFLLEWSSVSCKSLFGILGVALGQNISKCSRNKLESMIGLQLDHATLDNLLIPSPPGINLLYDVNLIVRFLKSFLLGGDSWVSLTRLRKVANLIDMYIAEVAPDPSLKPSKFVALAIAIPSSARDSYDQIYRAVDMYLEVHSGLSEEDKLKICCVIRSEKLSSEAFQHLAQNTKFPSRTTVQALITQQTKLKDLLQDTNHLKPNGDSSPCRDTEYNRNKDGDKDQVVLYARKLDFSSENVKLKEHFEGMQWRVMELEKVCRKMQTQMAKVMKSRVSSSSNGSRSLPRLCS